MFPCILKVCIFLQTSYLIRKIFSPGLTICKAHLIGVDPFTGTLLYISAVGF